MYSLAWKNITHYRGRSLTTFVLTLVSTYLFVVYVAFMDGSHESMLRNSLEIYTGALQVRDKEYGKESSYDYLLEDAAGIKKSIASLGIVQRYAARLESFGLLCSDEESIGSMVTGIEPPAEARISRIEQALFKGRYLESNDTNAIYIGYGVAKKLGVDVGDTIAFVGSATDYSFAADNFRIVGIFKTGLYEFDNLSSFVNKGYFDGLMLSDNMASYIAIGVDDISSVDQIAAALTPLLPPEIEAATWKELMHSMVEAMEVDSLFGYISLGLFFVIIFFVIMIFGFINISSRIREFGLLRALGISSRDIAWMLFLETALLAVAAALIGGVLGGITSEYFAIHPIVIEGMAESYKEYGIVSDSVPTRFDLWTVTWNTLVVLLLDFAAIVYPIRFASGFTPVEAMRHV